MQIGHCVKKSVERHKLASKPRFIQGHFQAVLEFLTLVRAKAVYILQSSVLIFIPSVTVVVVKTSHYLWRINCSWLQPKKNLASHWGFLVRCLSPSIVGCSVNSFPPLKRLALWLCVFKIFCLVIISMLFLTSCRCRTDSWPCLPAVFIFVDILFSRRRDSIASFWRHSYILLWS